MKRTKKAVILTSVVWMLSATACAGQPGPQTQPAATSAKEADTLQETNSRTEAETTVPETAVPETAAPETAAETAKADILLTSAPEIGLADPLSSTLSRFAVQSGNYSWSYMDGAETVSMVACGSHPLDTNPEKAEKLKVTRYNLMDKTPYSVSAAVAPDRMTVREWDISQLGKTDAAESATTAYEDTFLIDLKPDKVYEIVAVWDEEKLADNGFCGEASYVVITE